MLDHIMDRELDAALAHLDPGTVLLGAVSMLSHIPHQILARQPEHASALGLMLSDGLAKMAAGQLEDLLAAGRRTANSAAILASVGLKTGERRATYAAMAARQAGAAPELIDRFAEFGRQVGIASVAIRPA